MYDLAAFGLSEMTMVGAAIRTVARDVGSLERASQKCARLFCEQFSDAAGHPGFVLARCYATLPLGTLPGDLADFARGVFPEVTIAEATQCLTLLGTYGDEPAWQSRSHSRGHKAIPLATVGVLESLPMVARLTSSLGLDAEHVIRPDPTFLLEKERQGFNVFHVEEALGSPYIPAQSGFVERYGVRSVVGFGFVIPPSTVFATILFARQPIDASTADLFKTLTLSLKLAMLPIADRSIFEAAT